MKKAPLLKSKSNQSCSSSGSTTSTPSFSLMVMQGSLRSIDNSESDNRSGQTEYSSPKPSSPMTPQMGRLQFQDGRIFEGEHIGCDIIRGKMFYSDGSVYVGSWTGSKRHGRGVCTFADGSLYEGEFYNGEFHGIGKMTWNDGGYYQGQWRKGEIHGRGMEIRPDGSLRHDGVWNNGVPIRSPAQDLRKNMNADIPAYI